MKKFLNKAKEAVTSITSRGKREVAALTAITATTMPMSVFATTGLMTSILDIIYKIFGYIGVLLLAWSIGMLVLAFKNEDADSKSRAMMLLVVSIVLIGVRTIIGPVISSAMAGL